MLLLDFELHFSDVVWSTFGVVIGIIYLIWWLKNRKPPKPPAVPNVQVRTHYAPHW